MKLQVASALTITLNPALDFSAGVTDLRQGAVNRASWQQQDPGGKGVNVAAFLAEKIPFLAIPRVIEHTLQQIENFEPDSLPPVLSADADARRVASAALKTFR